MFRLDQLTKLTAAVNATPDDLLRISGLLTAGQPEGLLADPGVSPDDYHHLPPPEAASFMRSAQPSPNPAEFAPVYGVAIAGPSTLWSSRPTSPTTGCPCTPTRSGALHPLRPHHGRPDLPRFRAAWPLVLRGLWPRRGQACVIETNDNAMLVKFFLAKDDDGVLLLELQPQRREFTLAWDKIRAVHAIVGGGV